MPKTALLSVSNKTGIIPLAHALSLAGYALLSTGGTAQALQSAGIVVTEIADYTASPEILGGRVKSLHPKIHAGILARRNDDEDMATLEKLHYAAIDLVVVNLYPFAHTIAQPHTTLAEAIENIDIGGPSLLRAAAKNYQAVTVLCDPSDYERVLPLLLQGTITEGERLSLARKVFEHTAHYDATIAHYLQPQTPTIGTFPAVLRQEWQLVQTLRYGENPQQVAAFYRHPHAVASSIAAAHQLQGKELSYNNINDADTAWQAVGSFSDLACVIVKHANPCGIALGKTTEEAYLKAVSADPVSCFGGVMAFNHVVDEGLARLIIAHFWEVVIAPDYSAAAIAILADKKNLRVLRIAKHNPPATIAYEYRSVSGGLLVQSPDHRVVTADKLQTVSQRAIAATMVKDMLFAWQVAKVVKSNAIVLAHNCTTIGIGAGQMSRVDAARIALQKAQDLGFTDWQQAVCASDAFFPFRDSVDLLAKAGIKGFIQPGGSLRDSEVITAADEHNACMAFTHTRHFRH